MKVVLSNPLQPNDGVATIPLPIPKSDYDNCIFILNALEIGSQFHADCKVEEISADAPILQCLVGSNINIDELDYLVKRMESFDKRELGQFQAVASSQDIHTVQDFINLTFCCQKATIVQDFSDLKRIGEFCHMDRNGGTMSQDDAQNMNFEKVAINLLQSNEGRITPYGVIYDKDFQMEQLYDGQHFPQYRYEDCIMEIEICTVDDNESTFLCLPMSELQLERAMQRGGFCAGENPPVRFLESALPEEADAAIDFEQTNITELNNLCQTVSELSETDLAKFGAVTLLAKPSDATELWHLAEQLDLFDFVPGISTAREYGKHMICESGHFEYDENLESYYDFEKYGRERMEQDYGEFNHRGYVSYQGFISIEEVLAGIPSARLEQSMGGM